jgi:hypothetical protein
MKAHMSRRPKLPVPFIVGIFSAMTLGLAWGLVYWNMPMPAPSIAVTSSVPAMLAPPPLLSNATPATAPPSTSPTTRLPTDSDPSLLPTPNPLQASSPPAQTVVAPSRSIREAPKARSSRSPASSAASAAASPLPTLPAPESPALQGVSPACIVELEKLCEGTKPGGARRTCFKENETKLSPACQRQMDQMATRIREDMHHFRTACAGDVKQLCPDIHPGGGSVLQCLEENYKAVSENCYQALKHFQERKAGRSL